METLKLADAQKKEATYWCGCGEISGGYWGIVSHNAASRKKPFEITIEEAWNVFLEQNKKCAISGMPLDFVRNYMKHNNKQTASLDRIDSSKGYTRSNIQWVHKTVNIMKNRLLDEEFLRWCQVISEHNCSKG